MTAPPWRVRVAKGADRNALASFRCADAKVEWELEVERFVQTSLLDWALAPGAAEDEPRILLVHERTTMELVALAAHERILLRDADRAAFQATQFYVVAVASAWQGRRVGDTERASDIVMSAAMADIATRIPPRSRRIVAVVHEENTRSIALCARYGLTVDLDRPAPSYRRLMSE